MGRVTRAKAADLAEKLQIDGDAVLELDSDARDVADGLLVTPERERTPLGEIGGNSGGSGREDGQGDLTPLGGRFDAKCKKGRKKARVSFEAKLNAEVGDGGSGEMVEDHSGLMGTAQASEGANKMAAEEESKKETTTPPTCKSLPFTS